MTPLASQALVVRGLVTEQTTDEPVIGATVRVDGSAVATVTDADGSFTLDGVDGMRRHKLIVNMVFYADAEVEFSAVADTTTVSVSLVPAANALGEVTVSGYRRLRSEAATVTAIREARAVANGVAGEQIRRTADKDASEVMRRVTGISVINDKFIIARGLSQRYNNVWINGVAMPGSEADSRSFSFDLIPSGQIDNIMVYKSPSPELPADFSGGFVRLTTRDTPELTPVVASLTVGYNTTATLSTFLYNKGCAADWLGFAGSKRGMAGGINAPLDNNDPDRVSAMSRYGFNNDWAIRRGKALPDMKLTLAAGKEWTLGDNDMLALTGSINYSRSSTIYTGMDNARYGRYNALDDKPEYLYCYTDDQYQSSVRWGAMLNLAWTHGKSRFNLRNFFNQSAQDRLTLRSGWQNISSRYDQEKTEYAYNARSVYCGQLAGIHPLANGGQVDWTAAYTFANRNQPDRRIINRQQNDLYGDTHYGEMQIDQNSIQRDFTKLNEHVASCAANYRTPLGVATVKVGLYGQYRTRDYNQRAFYYRYSTANLPDDFSYRNPITQILTVDNLDADKLYIYDDTDNRDSYSGHDLMGSAYLSAEVPIGRWTICAGTRAEYSRMTLRSYTTIYGYDTEDCSYTYRNLFPSLNATYATSRSTLLRMAYGVSTNRPEFREVSQSVYYDFELFSDIKGNPALKAATIHNADVRWEWYPGEAEAVTLGVFYKHFLHPIENTFLDAGGSYTYTFENADRADAYGVEIDLRKSLDFIGLPCVKLSLNGAIIKSTVRFSDNSLEHNRPMQGQSPYIINFAAFYQPSGSPLSASVMYNRIGKRIVGIGRTDISIGGSIDNDIPDMYELPRNAVDLNVAYTISRHCELKLSVKDLLGEDVVFCQFPKYVDDHGAIVKRRQVTRRFSPGTVAQLGLSLKL